MSFASQACRKARTMPARWAVGVDRGFAGYLRALAGEPQSLGAGQG